MHLYLADRSATSSLVTGTSASLVEILVRGRLMLVIRRISLTGAGVVSERKASMLPYTVDRSATSFPVTNISASLVEILAPGRLMLVIRRIFLTGAGVVSERKASMLPCTVDRSATSFPATSIFASLVETLVRGRLMLVTRRV